MATPSQVPSSTAKLSNASSLLSNQAQEIPIFLRKTYAMVDSAPQDVACWSEDGETFVVKDPTKFEKEIIPQYFKHSKFSSFVRQLNFYAFRKIKYADTIRIDPQLEAETANYWRFRHEKFQRGKPEWLADIKRINGQKQQQQQSQQQQKEQPSVVTSAPVAVSDKESFVLKSEVTSLKQRIEDMTKNIDQLTFLVHKVTLTQQAKATESSSTTEDVICEEAGSKRKKMDTTPSPPDEPVPDAALSDIRSMELEDMPLMPPSLPSPMPVEGAREASTTSELSDEGFVNQLFTVFKTEDFEFDEMESTSTPLSAPKESQRPRPELMEKLSDALALLPRDIQELIVDRLIEAITSPKQIQDSITAAHCLGDVKASSAGKVMKKSPPAQVPQSPVIHEEDSVATSEPMSHSSGVGLPLAAATLAALLSQYGQVAKADKQQQAHKTLPVIPVHG